MSALIIRSDKTGNRLFRELAKKMGAEVLQVNDEQYEDLALGLMMDNSKTGQLVSKDLILKKLLKK
jgi:hypothetical protein